MNRSYSKIRHIQEANHRLEKRLVENVITEEEEIDEANPITGMVKGLVQGGKNLVNKAMGTAAKKAPQYFDELPVSAVDDLMKAGVSRSTAILLGKLGKLKMTDALTRMLSPVRDEILITLRDIKNVISSMPKSAKTGDANWNNIQKLRAIEQGLLSTLDNIQVAKGQSIDLGGVYKSLKYRIKDITNANMTIPMSPTGKKLLMILQQNVGDAIQKFDEAISDIITK
jgi:hypothetical protein